MDSIGVVGSGAIGMLISAKLAMLGVDVHLFARRPEQVAILQNHGIKIDHQIVNHVRYYCSLDMPLSTSVDVNRFRFVIVAVKNDDIDHSFVQWLQETFDRSVYFVVIQNGIGHVERMCERIKLERLCVAVTTEAAQKVSDREVRHTGRGITRFGTLITSNDGTKYQQEISSVFEQAGFETAQVDHIQWFVLRKWILNCVINPLTARYRVMNGIIEQDDYLRGQARLLFDEAYSVALRCSEVYLGDQESLWDELLELCRKTEVNRSSMLQDLEAGRRLEWQSLNGELIRKSVHMGIAVPNHRLLESWMDQEGCLK